MWKRNESSSSESANGAMTTTTSSPDDFRHRGPISHGVTTQAVLGNTVAIKGEITGNEDLLINGQVEGSVSLGGYVVTIGGDGNVIADIFANEVEVEGTVKGDIVAEDKIIIRTGGNVVGNIKAPRVVLEEGCQFKGSVAMDTTASSSQYSSGIVDIETNTPSSFIVDDTTKD